MTITEELVSPELASEWLKHNKKNRQISNAYVQGLVRDILSGQYQLTHQPIAFDTSGVLIDGQHRLSAIVRAGVPVRLMVARNVPPDAMMVTDSGRPRTLYQRLFFAGHEHASKQMVAMVTVMLNGIQQKIKPTIADVVRFEEMHRPAIEFALRHTPNVSRLGLSVIKGVIARAFYHCDHDRLAEFGSVLSSGIVETKDDIAAGLLHKFLHMNDATGSQQARRDTYLRTERAVRAFVDREHIQLLRPASRELFPLPEWSQTQPE